MLIFLIVTPFKCVDFLAGGALVVADRSLHTTFPFDRRFRQSEWLIAPAKAELWRLPFKAWLLNVHLIFTYTMHHQPQERRNFVVPDSPRLEPRTPGFKVRRLTPYAIASLYNRIEYN